MPTYTKKYQHNLGAAEAGMSCSTAVKREMEANYKWVKNNQVEISIANIYCLTYSNCSRWGSNADGCVENLELRRVQQCWRVLTKEQCR